MRILLSILLGGTVLIAPIALAAGEVSASRIKAYYTRLPFDDHGFTGKYADIVVDCRSADSSFSAASLVINPAGVHTAANRAPSPG